MAQLGETALHLAIQWREKQVLQTLLKLDADWTVVDKVNTGRYKLGMLLIDKTAVTISTCLCLLGTVYKRFCQGL